MDVLLRLFALGLGAVLAYEIWRSFDDDADAEPRWIAALLGETLDRESTPIRFWAFVASQGVVAGALVVCAFLPPAQMRAMLDALTG